jgi:hypothetical protein
MRAFSMAVSVYRPIGVGLAGLRLRFPGGLAPPTSFISAIAIWIKPGGTSPLDRLDQNPYKTGFYGAAHSPAQVAQSVEQRTENPRVGGSIPPLGTIRINDLAWTAPQAQPSGYRGATSLLDFAL